MIPVYRKMVKRLKADFTVHAYPVALDDQVEGYKSPVVLPAGTIVKVTREQNGMVSGVPAMHGVEMPEVVFEESELVTARGLMVSVLRHADGTDCTLKGVSSRYHTFVLCGPGIDPVFEETEDMPALKLWTRDLGGVMGRYTVAVPFAAETSDRYCQFAFGSNFVFSTDSRVRRACPPYGCIPVHDRDMSKERR